jgi:hypothetical protein
MLRRQSIAPACEPWTRLCDRLAILRRTAELRDRDVQRRAVQGYLYGHRSRGLWLYARGLMVPIMWPGAVPIKHVAHRHLVHAMRRRQVRHVNQDVVHFMPQRPELTGGLGVSLRMHAHVLKRRVRLRELVPRLPGRAVPKRHLAQRRFLHVRTPINSKSLSTYINPR